MPTNIDNSYCGKVGRDLIEHILTKLTPSKPNTKEDK